MNYDNEARGRSLVAYIPIRYRKMVSVFARIKSIHMKDAGNKIVTFYLKNHGMSYLKNYTVDENEEYKSIALNKKHDFPDGSLFSLVMDEKKLFLCKCICRIRRIDYTTLCMEMIDRFFRERASILLLPEEKDVLKLILGY